MFLQVVRKTRPWPIKGNMKLYLNHEPKVIYMRFIHGENLSLKGLLLWDPHYKFSKLRAGFLNPLRAGRRKIFPLLNILPQGFISLNSSMSIPVVLPYILGQSDERFNFYHQICSVFFAARPSYHAVLSMGTFVLLVYDIP